MEFEALVTATVAAITYKEGYRLLVERDKKHPDGRLYMQVECDRVDTVTHEMGTGRGGKAYLSEYMLEDELVQIAFGLFRAYEEHECREWFQWAGRRVFGPHTKVRALWEAAEHVTYRS